MFKDELSKSSQNNVEEPVFYDSDGNPWQGDYMKEIYQVDNMSFKEMLNQQFLEEAHFNQVMSQQHAKDEFDDSNEIISDHKVIINDNQSQDTENHYLDRSNDKNIQRLK